MDTPAIIEDTALTKPVEHPRVQRNVAWLIVNGLCRYSLSVPA